MEENPVIFANGFVLTCDPANRAGRFHIVVRDGRIQEIGGFIEVLKAMYPTASVLDMDGKLLVPGFVNAHYHTESFLLQEVTAGKPFNTWAHSKNLRDLTQSLFEPAKTELLRDTLHATYAAHVKSGTTCLGEFPPSVDRSGLERLSQASEAVGLRTVPALQTWDQIAHAREGTRPSKKYLVALGREEEYTVYSFENFVRVAREVGLPIVAHLAEQHEDVEILRKNFSKGPTTLLRDFGALQPSTLLVHLNHGSSDDANRLSESGSIVALCPLSSMLKQCGYPFLRILARNIPRLCIGTDWGNVDLLAEVRFLKSLPSLFAGMPEFSASQLIRMITIDGADSLGMSDDIGSIEVGKHADIVALPLLDIRRTQPEDDWSADDVAREILSAPSPNPVHVMIHGRFVVKDAALATMNEDNLIEAFRRSRKELVARTDGNTTAGSQEGGEMSGVKPRIYSFSTGERGTQREAEGYIGGFTEDGDSLRTADENTATKQDMPRSPQSGDVDHARHSEKPGHIKKIFGEDDVE